MSQRIIFKFASLSPLPERAHRRTKLERTATKKKFQEHRPARTCQNFVFEIQVGKSVPAWNKYLLHPPSRPSHYNVEVG